MTEENKVAMDSNPLDDIVDLKEDGQDVGKSMMFVAVIRHLMTPFLIVFFCFFHAALTFAGLYLALKGKLDIKDTFVLSMSFVGNIVSMIVGYRFGKGATADKK